MNILTEAGQTAHTELPIAPEAFAVIFMCAFIALLLVTLAFRGVGERPDK